RDWDHRDLHSFPTRRSSDLKVVAATGKAAEADYLRSLGASEVIDRAALSAPGKPLQKERWTAVVDAVGSHTLANACAQTRYGGADRKSTRLNSSHVKISYAV